MVEFNSEFYQQISTTARPYASIFMDYIETEFLKSQEIKPCVWKDSSMIHRQIQRKILIGFRKILTNFIPTFYLPTKSREKNLISSMQSLKLKRVKLPLIFCASLRMVINTFIMIAIMQNT